MLTTEEEEGEKRASPEITRICFHILELRYMTTSSCKGVENIDFILNIQLK